MRIRNRHRYRNSVRMPVILFFVIVGGLVGKRWIKEIEMHYLTHRLNTELRQVQHDIAEMESDINSLTGRQSELLTEDALEASVKANGIVMEPFDSNTIISVETSAEMNGRLAQNNTNE